MNQQQIDRLREIGNEWQNYGRHRIYINNLGFWYGIETERYGSGNICSATLNGQRISNSQARRILGDLLDLRMYYDFSDDKFHWSGDCGDYGQIIVGRIREHLNGAV